MALTSVSCTSPTLCVAVDEAGNVLLSINPTAGSPAGSGANWNRLEVDAGTALTSVSCVSPTLCVALDSKGNAFVSTNPTAGFPVGSGANWNRLEIDAGMALTSVSCTSPTLCVAVDSQGNALVSAEPAGGATAWHKRAIDPGLGLVAVSCFSAGSCVAIDGAGNALASSNVAAAVSAGAGPGSGATWSSTAFDVLGAPSAVSCAPTGLCVAADGTGDAFASDDPTTAPPSWSAIAQTPNALTSVACVAEGLCVAVSREGRASTTMVPVPAVTTGVAEEIAHKTLPPVLVEPHPSISGIPAPGQRLTCKSGVSSSGVTLTYAWLRNLTTIEGASGSTYVVGEADVSHHLQCRVTATTAEGSKSATSAFVTVPAGGLGTISETTVGTPRIGRGMVSVALRCSPQAAGSCTIKLRLTVLETLSGSHIVALAARTRRVTVTVGASTVWLKPGQQATATVALNAPGRRFLERVRRLAVKLSVSGTVVGAISASLRSATLTLTTQGKATAGAHKAASRSRTVRRRGARQASSAATPLTISSPTPYMGWDTYFTFGAYYNEASVLAQASQLVTRGLEREGYNYVWLDVGWWQGTRNAAGEIMVSSAQWPHGMRWLTSTLHASGFKVGLYTDAGSEGCGGPTQGSYGHYQQDVNTFAAWGFDAVKVDFCGGVRLALEPAAAYAAFHEAIVHNSSHRPMLVSICDFLQPGQFAAEDPALANSAFTSYTFGPSDGNSWRTDTDVGVPGDVEFSSVLRNLDADAAQPQAAGPGHWNDPDYLGPDQGMSAAQFRTQFSMWVMLAAPLMVSANLISLSHASETTISTLAAIAIDQDPAGLQARLLASNGDGQVWVKPLSDGSRAIALLNRGSGTLSIATSAAAVGMPAARGYELHNVWTGAVTNTNGSIVASVPGESTVLLRVYMQ